MIAAEEVVLVRDIDGPPCAADFKLRAVEAPSHGEGEILVRTIYLSLDPYVGSILRGRHFNESRPRAGDVVPGRAVAEVLQSRAPGFAPGDLVRVETGWRSLAVAPASGAAKISRDEGPLSAQLGAAGMPGLTAYAGMKHLAKVGGGEHVLVSAAAGGVGGAAGQIARILGAEKVVGLAGSAEKCARAVETFGFDDCINYRAEGWRDDLKLAFPRGIDLYFDNVGGQALDAALAQLAHYGRVVLCGLASQYQTAERPAGPNPGMFIAKRAQVFGLVVYDFEHEQEAYSRMASAWIREGRLAVLEDRAEGLVQAPSLFEKLMRGENVGKTIVVVGPEKN